MSDNHVAKKCWVIRYYDEHHQPAGERKIPLGKLSEAGCVRLLQRLAARHLSMDEVIDSSLRKDSSSYVTHLEITRDAGRRQLTLMTQGTDCFYVAIAQEDET